MARCLEWGVEEVEDPSLDIVATELDQQSLLEAREAVVGREQAHQEQKRPLDRAKESIAAEHAWEMHKALANIRTMVRLLEPALKAKDADGTKKQKVACLSYWTTFCAAFRLDGDTYGGKLPEDADARTHAVREEMTEVVGFAGYVAMLPREKGKASNSIAHAERAVGEVRAHYEGKNGRAPGTGTGEDFSYYVMDALRGLGKVYPSEVMMWMPLLADDMRALKATMDLNNTREATLRALWLS